MRIEIEPDSYSFCSATVSARAKARSNALFPTFSATLSGVGQVLAVAPQQHGGHQQQRNECQQGRARAGHEHGDQVETQRKRQQRHRGAVARAGQQVDRKRQRAHHKFGKEVAVDKGGSWIGALGEKREIDPELQGRPERRKESTRMDAPGQGGQALAVQRVQAQPEQDGKNEPPDGFDPAQVGV